MPGLVFTVGGNATQFSLAMNTVAVTAKKAGAESSMAFRAAQKQLEGAMAAAQGAGQSTKFYAAALRQVNEQLAILEVAEAKAIASTNALALARAKASLGMANSKDRKIIQTAEVAAAAKFNQGVSGSEIIGPDLSGAMRAKVAAARAAESDMVATTIAANLEKVEADKAAAAARKITDAEMTEALIRDTTGALEWNQIAEEEKVAAAAKAAAERVAIEKAAQLAMLKTVAAGGTASAFGHGGGGGGGISGVMRETLVIFRELGRGNMTRVPGSLLLLLQYTGLLNLMMKSEKTEALLAAAAQEKLAQSTARAAMAAEAKLRAAKIAAGIDVSSPELKTAEAEVSTAAATAEEMRAEATNLAADSEANSADATAANLLALEAERDLAIKAGVAETMRARETAAAAATIRASAATTLTAMGLMVLPVLLLVAAIVAWYIAIKNLIGWLHKKNAAIAVAMEIADKYKTSIAEQIEFEEKLAEAIKRTTDALHKMNEAKNHSVELAQEAIAAAKAEAEAQEKLNDAATKSKMLGVDLAEKTGQITHREAIQQKADIEKQSVSDKAAATQAALDNEAAISKTAADKARTDKAAAQQAFQAASDAVNKSPEGVALQKKLADAEKTKKLAEEGIADARKGETEAYTSGPLGGKNQKDIDAFKREQEAQELALKESEALIVKLKAKMSPAQIAAEDAETNANEATTASTTLDETARKAAIAAATNAKNSPAEVSAQQANIQKQADIEKLPQAVTELDEAKKAVEQAKSDLADAKKRGAPADEIAVLQRDFFSKNKGLMEMQGTENKPVGLNERQRIGAFTAQGGNPLVPLQQRNNNLTAETNKILTQFLQQYGRTAPFNGVQY